MITCVFCNNKFERTLEGKCPHCQHDHPKNLRKCPDCNAIFKMGCQTHQPLCPECGVDLYLPKGKKHKGETRLLLDKTTAEKLVCLLETLMGKRSDTVFAFEFGERSVELVHAYALIDRSKTFLKKQNQQYGLNPHDFIMDVMAVMLADRWWRENIRSYAMVRDHVGKYALEVFEQKKQAYKANEAMRLTYVDYRVMMPEWN